MEMSCADIVGEARKEMAQLHPWGQGMRHRLS
jgi:hypothetical protein